MLSRDNHLRIANSRKTGRTATKVWKHEGFSTIPTQCVRGINALLGVSALVHLKRQPKQVSSQGFGHYIAPCVADVAVNSVNSANHDSNYASSKEAEMHNFGSVGPSQCLRVNLTKGGRRQLA